MKHPDFFDSVKPIVIRDELGEFLGSIEGDLEISYLEAVKHSGHSCPTIASSFVSIRYALEQLYGDKIPARGDIEVFSSSSISDGVNGVVMGLFSFITGARGADGFKGIGGRFSRTNLLHFDAEIKAEYRVSSIKLQKHVDFNISLDSIPFSIALKDAFVNANSGTADSAQLIEFGHLWQLRVQDVLMANSETICQASRSWN